MEIDVKSPRGLSAALVTVGAALLLASCGSDREVIDNISGGESLTLAGRNSGKPVFAVDTRILEHPPAPPGDDVARYPERIALFGDLHVHTEDSFDAYTFGSLATPADAYRYGRGEAIDHPAGFQIQLDRPLDFYAVTDHAMLLGVAKTAADTTSEVSRLPVSEPLHDFNRPGNLGVLSLLERGTAFGAFVPEMARLLRAGEVDPELVLAVTRSTWAESIDATDRAYVPGEFTTFAAYEYTTSTDQRGNLHRNVIFRDTGRLPAVPFSRLHDQNPEGLWAWMDSLRGLGIESLAIPHNSNGSNGEMFKQVDWSGEAFDEAYTRTRMRNEPLVEITQIKGTSETHPLLSDTDEWAGFELMEYRVGSKLGSAPGGSYVREALRKGLELDAGGTGNPYGFGFIGSTDTHVGGGALREDKFFSKAGVLDGLPDRRGSVPVNWLIGTITRWVSEDLVKEVDGRTYIAGNVFEYWGAAGLAAVWAESNTRESIYEALRRRETFATTGPRIKVRFFASHAFPDALAEDPALLTKAYALGVPMGSELVGPGQGAGELKGSELSGSELNGSELDGRELNGRGLNGDEPDGGEPGTGAVEGEGQTSPSFLVWAMADPAAAPLDRLQVIKGWEHNGESFEKVFDVACSDGGEVDPATHRCPDNGAWVSAEDCSIPRDIGAGELKVQWRDPEFRPDQRAFYYLRVLENPTCRWSTWDALRAGVEPRSDLPRTLQERAWSSPIWYSPATVETQAHGSSAGPAESQQ